MTESLPRRLANVTRQATTAGVVLVLAYLLSQFLPHGAVGVGKQDGQPDAAPQNDDRVSVVPAAMQENDSSPQPVTAADLRRVNPLKSGVLTVLIDEREYFVVADGKLVDRHGNESEQPISIDEVCDLARQATGDANGIRVRVLRRTTARASAEQQLFSALEQVGISGDRIYMPSELEP